MGKTLRGLVAAAALVTVSTSPLLAQDPSNCYDRVMQNCARALEDANWLEAVAIGVLCTGLLVGCTRS